MGLRPSLAAMTTATLAPHRTANATVTARVEYRSGNWVVGPASDRVLATMLFADIVGSTQRAAELGDRRWLAMLGEFDRLVERDVAHHRGKLINWTGDGMLATFDTPSRAVHAARAIRASARTLELEVRAGLHTGECEALGGSLAGIAVNLTARVMAKAWPGEILASSTVRDLVVGSGLDFDDRGTHDLKGVPGSWHLFAVRR